MSASLTCTAWGVRGSIPTPLDRTEYRRRAVEALAVARAAWEADAGRSAQSIVADLPAPLRTMLGGETTCLEVMAGEERFIVDMGTGARRLGYHMMATQAKSPVNILLTHTHWDHIQGWPFFIPGYIPTNVVRFYSTLPDLKARFDDQQVEYFFPVTFEGMLSTKEFYQLQPGKVRDLDGVNVTAVPVRHPGEACAYRFEYQGKVIVTCPDCAFSEEREERVAACREYFEGADLLVMDGQLAPAEASDRGHQGHTAIDDAIRCALDWKVRHLVITHHEPARTDPECAAMLTESMERVGSVGELKVSHAREDKTYKA